MTQIPQFLQLSSKKTDLNSLVHHPPDMLFSHSYSNRRITGRNIYILQMLENIVAAQKTSLVTSDQPLLYVQHLDQQDLPGALEIQTPSASSCTPKVTSSSLPIKIKEAISTQEQCQGLTLLTLQSCHNFQ